MALGLAAFVLLLFARSYSFDFVEFDDPDYVSANPIVAQGLSSAGVTWAFTNADAGNWIPLTWISHMLDVSLFGVNSGAAHLVNAVLHAASTAVLFLLLTTLTGAFWRSAIVAAVFGIHPLHVESVAWVSERKDVLHAFLWMLTMAAYTRFVRGATPSRYAIVVIAYAAALLAKPMAVTLPVVLLLIDRWPLRRIPGISLRAAIVEKIPLFALAGLVSIITFLVQRGAGAVAALDTIPLADRLANAAVSTVVYAVQSFWPVKLAPYYPLAPLGWGMVLGSVAVIATGIVLAVRTRGSRPYVLTGLGWLFVTLAPVIGIIQVGLQAHADRYMYIPQIGLALAIVWAAADLVERRPTFRAPAVGVTVTMLVMFTVMTWRQLGYWRNTFTLFERAVAVTENNYVAHHSLGIAYRKANQFDAAQAQYAEAIRIRPHYGEALANLAEMLVAEGKYAEAVSHLERAIQVSPGLPEARVNFGHVLNRLGRNQESIEQYRQAIRLRPRHGPSWMGLAQALADNDQTDEAVKAAQSAVAFAPSDNALRAAASRLLQRLGRTDQASALEAGPGPAAVAHIERGNALVREGRFADAVTEFQSAVRLGAADPKVYANLGAALASLGRYDEAITAFEAALKINPDLAEVRKNLELAKELKRRKG